jgi:hypothetical protein
MRMVIATLAVLVGSVATAGCGGEAPAPSSSSSTSAAAVSTTTAAPTTTIEGDSDDGRGSWRAEFRQLAGGDPAVVDAFNGASHVAVMDQVEAAKESASEGTATWEFESNAQVTFRSIAVAQIIFGSLDFGAHPSHQIGTIVIDSRSADPIMLVDLFTDQRAGLSRLSEQATKILAADGMNLGPDEPGAAPKAENFANWIPIAEGLEIHFAPYQFGVALPAVITVPWPALADVLAPAMADIAKG